MSLSYVRAFLEWGFTNGKSSGLGKLRYAGDSSASYISTFTLRCGHFTHKQVDIPSCSSTIPIVKAWGRDLRFLTIWCSDALREC
jgi:hypothetical protein